MDWTLGSLLIYLLIVFRILGCLMALPFLAPGIANVMKAALSIFLAFLLFPAAAKGVPAPALDLYYLVLAGQEVLLGLIMGFVVRLTFGIVSVAGEMASQEMGFRMSRQVDPLTGTQAPAITQFYQVVAFLLFFTVNGHYWIIVILARSYKASPLCQMSLNAGFGEWFAGLFTRVFSLGIQLSAPIFLLMLMISIGVGLLAKLVQGINVFDIGFPIRIGVGLIFIMLFIPFLGQTMHKVFGAIQEGLLGLLTAI
jgi:flagellar biosynthetic protein FliR